MNDLNKLREEFEKLPVIAHGIKHRQFYFDDQDDCYTPTSSSHYHDAVYANGALDAYQEQQAKIDAIVNIVREANLSGGNSSVAIVYDEIQKLLKIPDSKVREDDALKAQLDKQNRTDFEIIEQTLK